MQTWEVQRIARLRCVPSASIGGEILAHQSHSPSRSEGTQTRIFRCKWFHEKRRTNSSTVLSQSVLRSFSDVKVCCFLFPFSDVKKMVSGKKNSCIPLSQSMLAFFFRSSFFAFFFFLYRQKISCSITTAKSKLQVRMGAGNGQQVFHVCTRLVQTFAMRCCELDAVENFEQWRSLSLFLVQFSITKCPRVDQGQMSFK